MDKPQNYIILESVEEIEDNNKEKQKIIETKKEIHIIELTGEDEEITIGRGEKNDVKLFNETVSENHAVIKFIKNGKKLLLKNKSNKSGTLVLIQDKHVIISDKKKIFLQVGSTFIEASVISENKFNEIKKEEDPKIEEIKKRIEEKNKISDKSKEDEEKEKKIYGE